MFVWRLVADVLEKLHAWLLRHREPSTTATAVALQFHEQSGAELVRCVGYSQLLVTHAQTSACIATLTIKETRPANKFKQQLPTTAEVSGRLCLFRQSM
jgi:hypothetical protein